MITKAKICGINSRDALDAAIAGGADYIGLVFCAQSPRHLEISEARELADAARGKIGIVALTVDADDATLTDIVREVAPDFLQLHGRETPERSAEIKQRFGRPVVKAVAVRTPADVTGAEDYTCAADLILFDAKAPSGAARPGGHGRTFDWGILETVIGRMPFMLSGGLTPDNVAAAIAATSPIAVDVSSGVESAPGVKDPELIRRFLQTVKAAKHS